MPLTIVQSGKRVYVVGMTGGGGLRGRLAAMGLVPGTQIEVIRNLSPGPVIINVRGSRIMLGHGMAQKIMVA